MKISSRVIIVLTGLIILAITGCKKDTPYYPSKATLTDYAGTWTGSLTTFKNNQLITKEGTILLYIPAGSGQMEGVLSLDKIYALTEIQLRNGIYYFQVLNSDTLNPYCQNWNLSGWAELSSADKMHVIISGKECGEVGSEWVNYEGDFTLNNPDNSRYFSFGAVTHQWTYRVYTAGGDSCQIENRIDSVSGSVYTGTTTNDCNFAWGSKPFRWDLTPLHFLVLNNNAGNDVLYAFHADQFVNKPYYYYAGNDTNIVTLLGSDSLYVEAGGFFCSKYLLEQRRHSETASSLDRGMFFISNQYGIIRYQSTLINDTTDIIDQSLISKNF
jgi:hypothetical protein